MGKEDVADAQGEIFYEDFFEGLYLLLCCRDFE